MGQLQLTDNEIKHLKAIHKYTHNNSMKENRIRVVLAYDDGKSKEEIKSWLLLDLQTIRRYINDFNLHRIDSIHFEDGRTTKSGNAPKITEKQTKCFIQYLKDNIISDAKEMIVYCQTHFHLSYSLSGITKLLHRMGFVYKLVTPIPQKASTIEALQKQLLFEQEYQSLKEQLEKKGEKAYFLDGVHPTHNTQAGYAWIQKGEEKIVESNSGRDRININGAYDPMNGEVITIENETINSQVTLELFDAILEANQHTKGDIYCFCDNAKYYKSHIIQEAVTLEKYQRIKMIFLPPYSPNLNPIERIWRFFKKSVMENRFYKTISEFRAAVDEFFKHKVLTDSIREKLKRFASDNFHIRGKERLSIIGQPMGFRYNDFKGSF